MKQTTRAKQTRQAWKRYKQTSQGPRREEGADVQAENHISGVRQACQGSKPQSRDSLWITHHHSKHHYATQTTLYYSQTILQSLYGHPTTYFSWGSTVNANKRTLGKCIRKTLFFLDVCTRFWGNQKEGFVNVLIAVGFSHTSSIYYLLQMLCAPSSLYLLFYLLIF